MIINFISCSEYVGEWDREDNPLLEHRNLFPHCPFMRGQDVGNVPIMGENMEGDSRQLSAQSAALFEDGPRRAEQIRAAANRAFFELDSDDAVRRAGEDHQSCWRWKDI